MIVVYPDEIAWAIHVGNAPCKCCVGGFIVRVVRIGRGIFGGDILPQKIVEERPEGYRKTNSTRRKEIRGKCEHVLCLQYPS